MNDKIDIADLMREIQNLSKMVRTLDEKVDFLVGKKKEQQQKSNAKRTKISPMSDQDIESYKQKFNILYENWLDGEELKVTNELESSSPDELRRFADANNLNVTSKTSKDKTLQLISLRFREKKMLSSNFNVTKPLKEKE